MTRKTYIMSGHITTVSPLTFTPPAAAGDYKRCNGGIAQAGTNKGEHTLPTMGGALFFPATGIRGKLRRIATEISRQALSEQAGSDYLFKLDDYFLATLGGIKQGKSKTKSDSADKPKDEDQKDGIIDVSKMLYIRENNPLVSLFGAMDPMAVEGLSQVGFAVCDAGVRPDIVRYVRTNELVKNDSAWDALESSAYDELVEKTIRGKEKTSAKSALKDITAQLKKMDDGDEKEAMLADKKRMTDENKEDLTVNIAHPGLNYEFIPPGIKMNFRIVLKRVSEQELSLFLQTLRVFGYLPLLGSHASHGCGVVAMHLDVTVHNSATSCVNLGAIDIAGDYCGATMSPDVAALMVPLQLNAEAFSTAHLRKL